MAGFDGVAFKGLTEADIVNDLTNNDDNKVAGQQEVYELNSKIASASSTLLSYIKFHRFGNIVFVSIGTGDYTTNADSIVTSNGAIAYIPNGYKPSETVNVVEALNNKRIIFNVNGTIVVNNTPSTTSIIRVSACWITVDGMP